MSSITSRSSGLIVRHALAGAAEALPVKSEAFDAAVVSLGGVSRHAGKITPRTRLRVPGVIDSQGEPIHDYWDHGDIHLTAAGAFWPGGRSVDDLASIVDGALPDMTAVEFIRRVRSIEGAVQPRIAICLTEVDVSQIMRAKRAGAQGYLLKPFNRPQLLERFRQLQTAA